MDNIKNDKYYVNKIVENIDFILAHCDNLSLEDLSNDEVLVDSMMFRFIQIAENAQELSQGFINTFSDLPWRELNGIRNRIVHAYDVVRVDIVYDTIKNDLPTFRETLSEAFPNAETIEALKEAEEMKKHPERYPVCSTIEELKKALEK